MSEFEEGRSYHAVFDRDVLTRKFKVEKRTPKFIFVATSGQNSPQKLKVRISVDKEEFVMPSKEFSLYLYAVLEAEKVKNRSKFEEGKFYCLADCRFISLGRGNPISGKPIPITTRMMKVLSIKKKKAVIELYDGNVESHPIRTGNIKISHDGLSEYISFEFEGGTDYHETYYASLAAEKLVIADFLKRFL